MRGRILTLALSAGACLSVGCDRLEDGEGSAADGDTAAPSAASAPGAAPSNAVVEREPTQKAIAPPPGRSEVPSLEQWDASREVMVKGSSALSCETKLIREWFRVICSGPNDTGGTPAALTVTVGNKPDVFTYVSAFAVSLVMPFVEGVHLEAVFSWSDKSHKLVVKWPPGEKKPDIVGVFEGAKSPLDGSDSGDFKLMTDRLCDCFKTLRGTGSCREMGYGPVTDCHRTYSANCQKLWECTTGEPSAPPRCQPGYANGPFSRCYPACGDGKTCSAGQECQSGICM